MAEPVSPYGLGYLVVETMSDKVEPWRDFATDILGLMPVGKADHPGPGLAFRMDARLGRLFVTDAEREGFVAGWEYPTEAAWEQAAHRLEAHGVPVQEIKEDGALRRRFVQGLFEFEDPAGNRCEAFYGAAVEPLVPFRGAEGTTFVTGDCGMGHVTMRVQDLPSVLRFYTDVLGFRIREIARTGITAAFLGCNPRQHSLALIETTTPTYLAHLMVEVDDVDMVGKALDRCHDAGYRLAKTLGRHWNDNMLSFYVLNPSGFEIEYGCSGRRIPDEGWTQVTQYGVGGSSIWGHRVVLPDGTLSGQIGRRAQQG